MKKIFFLSFLISLAVFLSACGPSARDLPLTSLQSLSENAEAYKDQDVKVQGHVVEFLGENSHLIVLPYTSIRQCKIGNLNTTCTDIKIMMSQVRVAEFLLQSGDNTIVVSEQSGGMYLPIPFVPDGHPTLPEGELQIVGRWRVKQDGNYVLYISGSEKLLPTTTPSIK